MLACLEKQVQQCTGLVVCNCKLLEVERIQLSWWLRLGPSAATAHSFQSPFLTPELNNFHLIIPIIAAAARCSLLPTIWMALTLSLITSWSPEMDVPIRPCPVQSSAAPDTTPEMWKGPNGPYPAQPSPAQAVLCLELLNIDIDKKTIYSSEKMQRGSLKTEKVLVCKLLVPVLSAFVYSSSKNWGTLNITSQDVQSCGTNVSAVWRTAGCPQLSSHQPAAAPCP